MLSFDFVVLPYVHSNVQFFLVVYLRTTRRRGHKELIPLGLLFLEMLAPDHNTSVEFEKEGFIPDGGLPYRKDGDARRKF